MFLSTIQFVLNTENKISKAKSGFIECWQDIFNKYPNQAENNLLATQDEHEFFVKMLSSGKGYILPNLLADNGYIDANGVEQRNVTAFTLYLDRLKRLYLLLQLEIYKIE